VFIDSHFHLGYAPNLYFYDVTIESCLKIMDYLNISYCINAHSIGLISGNLRNGMEEDLKAYEQSKRRILSYFIFDPNKAKECIEIMDGYFNKEIFKGVKIHPSWHGVYADDPKYNVIWDYARKKKLPIISHTWAISSYNPVQKYSYPPRFESYIAQYPEVTFICGHSGGRYEGIVQCVKLAKKYNNVYLDTSGDVYNNRLIEYLVKEISSQRILFGSDAFWIDGRTQMGMILGADISLQEKEDILCKNAIRIFDI